MNAFWPRAIARHDEESLSTDRDLNPKPPHTATDDDGLCIVYRKSTKMQITNFRK